MWKMSLLRVLLGRVNTKRESWILKQFLQNIAELRLKKLTKKGRKRAKKTIFGLVLTHPN